MDIPLCKIILMQVVRLALHIDIVNMQKDFYVGYHLSSQVLYVSLKIFMVKLNTSHLKKRCFRVPHEDLWMKSLRHPWTQNQDFHIWRVKFSMYKMATINSRCSYLTSIIDDKTWHVCLTMWVFNAKTRNQGAPRHF